MMGQGKQEGRGDGGQNRWTGMELCSQECGWKMKENGWRELWAERRGLGGDNREGKGNGLAIQHMQPPDFYFW